MFFAYSACLLTLANAGPDALTYSLNADWAQNEIGAKNGEDPATLVLLTDAADQSDAKCLDGTPGAYYIRPGSGDGATKWYIHHQGGGWCTDLDGCLRRSAGDLGSSKNYPSSVGLGGGYWSQDPNANPMMYNWNAVYLRYCDGGSFSGLNASVTEHGGTRLHFRGKAILDAMQQDLLANGLNQATDVVISGCSAGGLATFLHADNWASLLEPQAAKVVAMPDSGFFLDYNAYDGDSHGSDCEGHYHTGMKWVFEYMDSASGVNQKCIEAHLAMGDTWKCIFAEHTAPHLSTPTFPLQGAYDSWQTGCDLKSDDPAVVNEWGQNLTALVEQNLLATNEKHGIFLDSCLHHCGGWGLYTVDGKSQPQAFQEWYEKGSASLPNKGYYTQAQVYPCTDCCVPAHGGENIWRQTTNPVTDRNGVEGYEAVDISYPVEFGGIEYQGGDTLFDGNVGLANWFYAVGTFSDFGGGIPGPMINGAYVTLPVVELNVWNEAQQSWVLMLRQTDGMFFQKEEFAKNKESPEGAIYAALDELEQHRASDRTFKFKLSWPSTDKMALV